MAAAVVISSSSSNSRVDQVFMCMKDGMRTKPHIWSAYDASKAAVRNEHAYWTHIADADAQRKEKFERRRFVLQRGFFTEKSKALKTIGTVHTDDGDLVLSGITDEFRDRMVPLPTLKKDSLEKAKKLRALARRPSPPITKVRTVKPSAGINAIKERINEVVTMKRLIFGEQSLSGYLMEKEAEMLAKETAKDPWRLLLPDPVRCYDDNKAVEAATSKRRSPLDATPDVTAKDSVLSGVETVKSYTSPRQPIKPFSFGDLEDFGDKSEVFLDEKSFPVAIARDSCTDGSRSEGPSELMKSSFTTEVDVGDSSVNKSDRKMLLLAAARTNASLASRVSKATFDTWDELPKGKPTRLAVRMDPTVPIPSAATPSAPPPSAITLFAPDPSITPSAQSKVVKPTKRNAIFPVPIDAIPPWMTILQTEKTIHEKKVLVFGKKQQKRKRAIEILFDLKEDFLKLQMKLDKHVQEECKKERRNQFKAMRYKFHAIRVGPPVYQALDQMRERANVKIRNRMDNTMQPMKWFSDLQNELARENVNDDEKITKIVAKIARFQYDDDKSIPFAKEKLCLLVMSLPAYTLLAAPMIHALICLLKVLSLPQEILQYWLSGRKFDRIGFMQKQMHE